MSQFSVSSFPALAPTRSRGGPNRLRRIRSPQVRVDSDALAQIEALARQLDGIRSTLISRASRVATEPVVASPVAPVQPARRHERMRRMFD